MANYYNFAERGDPAKAGNCRWCGNVLARYFREEVSHETVKPERCGVYGRDPVIAGRFSTCDGTTFTPRGATTGGWTCDTCGAHAAGVWKETGRRTTDDDPHGGQYGDGFFCGLRCGYMFAVRLAGRGRRITL